MIIVVNGESHTAATDPTGEQYYNYDKSWARWLADSVNASCINLAEPGSGAEQISRSTIIKIGQLIQKIEPKDLFVIILWGGFKRYEFWSTAERRHQSVSLKSTWKPEKKVLDYVTKRSELESDTYSYYKDLFHMYTTALALESYGVKYTFCNATKTMPTPEHFIETSELNFEYTELYNLYGSRKESHIGFHNKEDTFQEYLKDYPKIAGSSYWGVDGQKAYAKFVQKRLDFN